MLSHDAYFANERIHDVVMLQDEKETKRYYDKQRERCEGLTTGNKRYTDEVQEEILMRKVFSILCAPKHAPDISVYLAKALCNNPNEDCGTAGTRLRWCGNPRFTMSISQRPFSELQSDQAKIQYEFSSGGGQIIHLPTFVSWSIYELIPELHGSVASILPSFKDKDGQPVFLAVARDLRADAVILALREGSGYDQVQ